MGAAFRHHRLQTVVAQQNLKTAEGALPREKTQQGQYFTLKKTNPVQTPEPICMTPLARLLHRLEKLHFVSFAIHYEEADNINHSAMYLITIEV